VVLIAARFVEEQAKRVMSKQKDNKDDGSIAFIELTSFSEYLIVYVAPLSAWTFR
jgi:hypothetical protein